MFQHLGCYSCFIQIQFVHSQSTCRTIPGILVSFFPKMNDINARDGWFDFAPELFDLFPQQKASLSHPARPELLIRCLHHWIWKSTADLINEGKQGTIRFPQPQKKGKLFDSVTICFNMYTSCVRPSRILGILIDLINLWSGSCIATQWKCHISYLYPEVHMRCSRAARINSC